MRILHTPTNVGGHPIGLARAEREMGLQSEVVVLEPNPFGFEVDRSLYRPGVPPWRTAPERVRFLAEVVRRYDVIHFNFGTTLLPGWGLPVALDELPLLRRLGKIVVATFQGDDARPGDHQSALPPPGERAGIDRRRRHGRERMLRYAHRVLYLNPDLRQWLPGAHFCAYASFDPWSVTPVPPRVEGQLTILHAPSNRAAKGTADVLAAIDEIRVRGYDVRLDLVEGVTREEALARCAAADIAIDQVKIGWYGGFAVEAMSLGKPALCYIQEDEPGDNPFGDALGLVRTTAATLADDLIGLIESPDRRLAAGAGGRAFVERHHDPRVVARTVLDGLVALPETSSDPPSSSRRPGDRLSRRAAPGC
jgi:glycosyltransferase involved in cell wall biosynthesis